MDKKFKRTLVTSALPYANGPVHIGHLAGVYIPADIYVRYLRMRGEDVLFICGSDEHGVPITIKARQQGVSPQDIVDRYHKIIKDSFTGLGINFDVSQYAGMRDALDKLVSTSTNLEEELFSRQSINQIMNECISSVGVPVEKMGKYDRIRIIQMLYERNVFQMQKAVPYVAERLKISRYTVYNYLKELGGKE